MLLTIIDPLYRLLLNPFLRGLGLQYNLFLERLGLPFFFSFSVLETSVSKPLRVS